MNKDQMVGLAQTLLVTWTAQVVEDVVALYSDDVRYRDPNTRGCVEGSEAMRRYLTKLFRNWKMSWRLRELYPFVTMDGCAVLWSATLQVASGGPSVEIDGMDLVVLRGDKIARNEVYFDRTALVPLLGSGPA